MAIGESGVKLALNIRELIDHSQSADMVTNYHKGRFNHGNSCRLLHQFLRENADEKEIKLIYPKGL